MNLTNINFPIDLISDTLIHDTVFLLLKLFFILAGIFYIIFAFVAVRQISIMKETLITEISPLITTLGWVHFICAISAVAYFIFIL